MIILGLTGSIGMGKSTTAKMLQEEGVPVHDSDAAVHKLLSAGGAGEAAVLEAFPSLTAPINRKELGALIFGDDDKRAQLESILHPLVREDRNAFIADHKSKSAPIVAADIPLLYETGCEADMDAVIVVTAPEAVQRERVLARPTMTEEKLTAILARQMPDAEKRKRADYIIDTSLGLDHARAEVQNIIKNLKNA